MRSLFINLIKNYSNFKWYKPIAIKIYLKKDNSIEISKEIKFGMNNVFYNKILIKTLS